MSGAIPKHQLVAVYRQALGAGVDLQRIDDRVGQLLERTEVNQVVEQQAVVDRKHKLQLRLPAFIRLGALVLPLLLVVMGVFLVGSAAVPIATYYVKELPQLQATKLLAPIPFEEVLDVNPVVVAQTAVAEAAVLGQQLDDSASQPVILDTQLDYTNLNNWFGSGSLPELEQPANTQSGVSYRLDIPTLNITNAMVTVGGTNLNKSLVHYAGTAMPGELGAPVIFGHSVLTQFYNPSEKNPRRYNSIFTTIMNMKKGDKIYLTNGNVKYTYQVQEKTEVKPTDVHILAQKYDSRHLKLVTCVPVGTYLRRGVVTAVLVQE